jgi:hypothetical protein
VSGVVVEPVYNLEVEGDHCYRVGRQGLLVHNASIIYSEHQDRYPATTRELINRCNYVHYFDNTTFRILQIASGNRVFPGALSEDIRIWSSPRGNEPKILVTPTESLVQYLPAGMLFDEVLAVNANNPGVADHSWIFTVAAPVLKSGGRLILVGLKTAASLIWAVNKEAQIDTIGFTKSNPTKSTGPGVGGNSIDAESQYKALGASYTVVTPGSPGTFSMQNARQIEYRKK